jgi:membrane protein YdbS with pleckstrin-like domain
MENKLKKFIKPNEKIMWEGRPDKEGFTLETIFHPLLIFALVVAEAYAFMIFGMYNGIIPVNTEEVSIIPFLIFISFPIYLYLGRVILVDVRYRNTYYIITNAGVYHGNGVFTKHYEFTPLLGITNINITKGRIDRRLKLGCIKISAPRVMPTEENKVVVEWGIDKKPSVTELSCLKDYWEVYYLLKNLRNNAYNAVYEHQKNGEYTIMGDNKRKYM